MKKQIECPECESTFQLTYKEEDVDGTPEICPFCGAELEDDHIDLTEPVDDPLDIEEEDE